MEKRRILIIAADDFLGQQLDDQLRANGFEVIHCDADGSLQTLSERRPDVVLACTYHRRIENCLQGVRQIRRQDRSVPVIMLTRFSSESRAIAAFRAGVDDYYKIPFPSHALLTSIGKHAGAQPVPSAQRTEAGHRSCILPCPVIIGQSRAIQEIKSYLRRVAATDSTVFITGETGTGKEIAAEMVHCTSSRRDRPFVRINCAAIPDELAESEIFGHEKGAFTGAAATKTGKFEQADGGSVLLDEIGDMCTFTQAKILRTIERKEVSRLGGKSTFSVDVRVIAATNRNPEVLMSEGKFRKDLFYRLNVAQVQLPPLRERKEDIPNLLQHFISKYNQKFGRHVEGFSDEALNYLLSYSWPGNVRELKNLVEVAFINMPSHHISVVDLPRAYQKKLKDTEGLPRNERDRLLATLFATNWNKSKTARELHWSRMTVYRKMEKYRLEKKLPENSISRETDPGYRVAG